ncbi:HYR domain-containing protein [Fluviicola sp.]|uniref:HYR domain-containing protein n=1 Tax=Fluviicola sp. TaxID=1917219 RepID=UPI003D27C248
MDRPGVVSGASTDAATVNAAGTYSVLVTNPTTGCTSTSSVAVNYIADNIAPVITCPSNISVNTTASTCNASVAVPNPVINDNCGVTQLTWSMGGVTPGSSPGTGINYVGTQTFNLGTTPVTYTIRDASNNQTTCSFTVTVIDNVNPTISCPANMNAFTSTSSCSASVVTPNPTVSDNCTVSSLSWTITQGATTVASGSGNLGTRVFSLGTSTVTYTVTDGSGNSSTCSYTVTVTDNVNPTISCPSNMNAFTSSSTCTASIATPNPTVSDNCTVSSLTWIVTQGAVVLASGTGNLGTHVFSLGTSTVNYTLTDGSGNSSTCSYTVTVTDNVNPTLSCSANMNVFTSSSACTASIATPNPTVSDNCTVASLNWSITQGALVIASGTGNAGTQVFNLGTSTVTYTVTDASGNTSNCSYSVTVTDNVAPTISCPANVTANTSSTSCDASIAIPNLTFSDNCTVSSVTWVMTGATVAVSPSSGINQVGTQTFNSGTTTIFYTVRDAANNPSTCSFTVTVTDATPPVVPTLPDVTGQCTATAPIPVATDNCAGFVNGTTSDPLTYNSQGTFTIHWTFTDAAGNSTTANQTVIIDNSLPPTAPVLAVLYGECSVTADTVYAATGCSGLIAGTTSDPLYYDQQGTYTITWTFDDGMGNVVTANQTVIVDDITPPVAPTVNPLTAECAVNLVAPTTTDNCPGTIIGTTSNPTSYSTQGTFNVLWTFDDGHDNTTSVIQTVTIADITAPTFSGCPSNIAVSNDNGDCGAVVSWTPPTAADNCSGFTVTSSHNPGDFFNLGATTVTYALTDAGGNTVTCTFDVEVTDTEAPVITSCPSNISVSNDPSVCGAMVTWTLPVATDNCPGVTMTSTHNSGDNFPLGTTTVTYSATDAAGNTATCTFDITVNDTEAPVFTNCPSDITVNNDPGVCGAVVNWIAPTATDNCSAVSLTSNYTPGDNFPTGTTTVIYTATDAAGNTFSCSFDVTVNDVEAPVISGLADLSVCEGNVPTWSEVITDNCPGVTYTSNYTSGTNFPLGNTTVTYTATDVAGNQTTVSFVVNVYPLSNIQVTVSPSSAFCVGDEVNLAVTNPSAGAVYTWSFNNAQVGTGSSYQFVSGDINQSGSYTVSVILPGGCQAYGDAMVSIDFCELIIPEAVTPNADGMNDTWYIENLESYPNSTVQIVNRWGAVVFESDDYKNDWDGTSQNGMNIGGDELPEGTFYYVLRIGGNEASKFYHKVYTGYIYLKRK